MKPSPDQGAVATRPPPAPPTLRSLAKHLGFSRTTISDALRGNPRVNIETVRRIRAAADAAGYERNPLTGAVMSRLRKSRSHRSSGVLAVVETVEAERTRQRTLYNEALFEGIRKRADDFGFEVELFEIGPAKLRVRRFETILHTRGIQGLLILPSPGTPDYSSLQWHRYAAMYLDHLIDRPSLHAFCPDHHRSMANLLRELHARGYRRPGLFMDAALDEHLQFRWEGAFLAQQYHPQGGHPIPPLRLGKIDRPAFEQWFKRHQPDVVLGHFPDVIPWITACGGRIPSTHGFVCLNHLRAPDDCAALDLQAAQIGARATEFVIAQLMHGEFGVPAQAAVTGLPARLIEGGTLRPAPARSRPGLLTA